MRKISEIIERDREELAVHTEKLQCALIHFRYEGKVQRAKNVKILKSVIAAIDRHLKRHQGYQEKILFPFLERHVPKYEPAVRFFQSDHQELFKKTKKVKESLRAVRSEIGDVHHSGVYLVCLLHHHMQLEKTGLQKALEKGLNGQERAEIGAKVQGWVDRHSKKAA